MITVDTCREISRRGRLRSQQVSRAASTCVPGTTHLSNVDVRDGVRSPSNAIVAQVRSTSTEIRYLSGTGKDDAVLWDFFCTEGRNSGVWSKIHVPSNWETEGFGSLPVRRRSSARLESVSKRAGEVQAELRCSLAWKNRVVRLVFEGSMTDTEVGSTARQPGPVHKARSIASNTTSRRC